MKHTDRDVMGELAGAIAKDFATPIDDHVLKASFRPCSGCGLPNDAKSSRYCRACKRAYMKTWRKTHPLKAEARRRANARSYANVYLRRGKIEKMPCAECGSPDSLMRHTDYRKPLSIVWLCRSHNGEGIKR